MPSTVRLTIAGRRASGTEGTVESGPASGSSVRAAAPRIRTRATARVTTQRRARRVQARTPPLSVSPVMASSPTDSGGREESRGAGSSTDTACVTLDAACTPPEKALSPRVWMPRTAARVAAVMDSNSAQTPTDHREREAPDVVLNITPPSRARSDQRLINNRGTSLKNCPKTLDIEATLV
ncbi:hypothetical protein [Frigoribacterium salinisoli]